MKAIIQQRNVVRNISVEMSGVGLVQAYAAQSGTFGSGPPRLELGLRVGQIQLEICFLFIFRSVTLCPSVNIL